MIALTLGEIAAAIGSGSIGDGAGIRIDRIVCDSRIVGPTDLFCALDGERSRGSDFIPEAFARGARAVLSSRPGPPGSGGPVLVVDDPYAALMSITRFLRRRFTGSVIGITGTNGKTTTKDVLGTLLDARFRTVRSAGSYNNKLGLPLTFFQVGPTTEALVLEMGTSAPGEIRRLTLAARPHRAMITSIGPGHLEGLGSIEGVLAEKLSIAEGLEEGGILFVNGDDLRLATLTSRWGDRVQVVRYGTAGTADFRVESPLTDAEGVSFRYEGVDFRARLFGRHNLLNLAGAVAVAWSCGMKLDEIAAAAAAIAPTRLRMEPRRVGDWCVVFDCYNANPASMAAALAAFEQKDTRGRRVAVLGDMLELGPESPSFHAALGRSLAASHLDRVVLVGDGMRAAASAAVDAGLHPSRIAAFDDAGSCRRAIREILEPEDRVLVKGSRGMALERIFEEESA